MTSRFTEFADRQVELKRLFAAYGKAKRRQNLVDFDDLLWLWRKLMKAPGTRRQIRGMFDHVLVDEFQDTNALQAKILRRLKPKGDGLTVVGDDAQSIYGFRAADVGNIVGFPQQFTPPATVITLDRNYRSTKPILDAANAVIAVAPAGFKKTLRATQTGGTAPTLLTVADDQAQARFVVDAVLANRDAGMALTDQAVLFRNGRYSAELELEMQRRNVPFVKISGHRFVEAAHVQDVVAVLRWAENPKDQVSAARVLRQLPGFGPATIKRLLDTVKGKKLLTALSAFSPPANAAAPWRELVVLMRLLRASATPWSRQLPSVCAWVRSRLAERDAVHEVRDRDLDALLEVATNCASRQVFLADVTLDPPGSGQHAAADALTLSTIHGVKGKEFGAVFVLNVVDGAIPSSQSTRDPVKVAEECRLLYVAMTRAKNHLTLIMPKSSRHVTQTVASLGNRPPAATRSRFITKTCLGLFEQREDGSPIRSDAA